MWSSIIFVLTISFVVLFECGLTTADLPPEIEKCHAGDVKCIAKIIPEIFQRYRNGYAEFGLPNLEKILLKDVVISKANEKEAVALDLIFKTFNLYGISNITIDRIVGFEADPINSKFEVYCMVHELVIKGDYAINGKVLVLPITGDGFAEIHLKNAKLSLKFKLQEDRRENDKQYVKVKNIKGKIEPESMHVKFDNLFKGNKELGTTTNNLINENWKAVWDDMQSEINKAMVHIVNELLSSVLRTLSYDDFYRKD